MERAAEDRSMGGPALLLRKTGQVNSQRRLDLALIVCIGADPALLQFALG